jgi:hypothetical protein
MEDIITLMMIQQLFTNNSTNSNTHLPEAAFEKEDEYIDEIQNEILELLDEHQ